MSTYELIRATTNGTTDYLLIRGGKVVSRWPRLDVSDGVTGLDQYDIQADASADLSDYQADYDAGRFDVTVIARETH